MAFRETGARQAGRLRCPVMHRLLGGRDVEEIQGMGGWGVSTKGQPQKAQFWVRGPTQLIQKLMLKFKNSSSEEGKRRKQVTMA